MLLFEHCAGTSQEEKLWPHHKSEPACKSIAKHNWHPMLDASQHNRSLAMAYFMGLQMPNSQDETTPDGARLQTV